MSHHIVIDAPLESLDELVEELARRGGESTLTLPYDQPIDEGSWVDFSINLADGAPAFMGTGYCIGCSHDEGEDYYQITLDAFKFEKPHADTFDRVLAMRESSELLQASSDVVLRSIPPPRMSVPPTTNGQKGARAWNSMTDAANVDSTYGGGYLRRPVFRTERQAERFAKLAPMQDSGMFNYAGDELPVPPAPPAPSESGYTPVAPRQARISDAQELSWDDQDVISEDEEESTGSHR